MGTEKSWSRPQLVVLGRATPEESVLLVCKNHEVYEQYAEGYPMCSKQAGVQGNCRGVTGS
jgi:hypothetical protein